MELRNKELKEIYLQQTCSLSEVELLHHIHGFSLFMAFNDSICPLSLSLYGIVWL